MLLTPAIPAFAGRPVFENITSQIRIAMLTGSVLDHERKALAGVTISLYRLTDSVLIATTLSDEEGAFFFPRVREGVYYVEAGSISYQPFYSDKIVFTGKPVSLPPFILTERPTRLMEVRVLPPAKALEVKDGKLVFNVEKSISASGSTAFELLKKTPGISVDQDDNLVLKGSTTVTVLLDGKMTWLSPPQLSSLLKSMPAENLSRIEVIATPPSQYDAAGNAGVINIVTQKSNRQGYALNVAAGAGTGSYPQTAENLIGNIRTRAFNFFGAYNYDYNKWYTHRTSHRVISNQDILTQYDRESSEPVENYTHGYKAGVDVYLSKNETLSFIYSGIHHVADRNAGGPTSLLDGSGKLDSVVQNHNVTHEPNTNNSYTLDYSKKLDTLGKTFSADADYSHYDNRSDGYLGNQFYSPGGTALQPYQELDFQQPTLITIRTARADLILPFEKIKWTGGLKYSSVTTDNNFSYDSLINGSYVYSSALSNHFIYEEKIAAAYLTVRRPIGRIVLETGLRIENTLSTGNSLTTQLITKRNYTDLFPYLSLSHDINDNNSISFSLTRRVNRPVYSDLNPFRFFLDKYTYLEGNAYLQPEYAWTGSLNYVLAKNYITTLSYTRTDGAIVSFAQQDSVTGIFRISDYNFSHKETFDALLIVPVTISRKWAIQNTLDLSYLSYAFAEGVTSFRTSKVTVDLAMINTVTLPRNYTMELTAHYTSPSLAGVYVSRHYFAVDGGWKRSFLNQKLDIKLAFTDLFKTIHLWGYSVYKDANVQYNHVSDSRRVNLSLVYHFGGKLNVKTTSRSEEQERVQ